MGDTYLTRETLLKRIKLSTDDSAWEEFVEFYKPFIFATINRFGVNGVDCDDLLQKIVLKIWKVIPEFDYNQQQGRFHNWLYTIIKNTTLTFLSKEKYINQQKQLILANSEESTQNELDKIIHEEWLKHVSTRAYEIVSGKVSEVAMGVFNDLANGLGVEEVAEKYKITEGSVYVYRMRVKKAIIAEINNLRDMME